MSIFTKNLKKIGLYKEKLSSEPVSAKSAAPAALCPPCHEG